MGRRISRRSCLALAGAGVAGLVGVRCALPWWWRAGPVRGLEQLSSDARALVALAFDGLDLARVWDSHAHLVGLGRGSGCEVSDSFRSHLRPFRRLQYELYMSAAGVRDVEGADLAYVDRLVRLWRAANPAGKLVLLAFDRRVDEDGFEDRAGSTFHAPNEWLFEVARGRPEIVACCSVHPYRKDAVERLAACAARGARAVKWLPNAMGIDPAAPRCLPFYEALAELGLPLITHAGSEHAVEADEQELGNPLRLRAALEAGARVVVAHCASLGTGRDLDAGAGEVASFDAFRRLMAEPEWEGRLFGEISALTLVNRSGRPLTELLAAEELHPRLVNGSDYPLSAIDPVVSTFLLARRGYVDPDERGALEELFGANPLLFDLVLKRRLRLVDGADERRFAPAVFESARLFE